MLAEKVRPTEEMIRAAFEHNRDGGGAAWREGDEVVWKKGIRTVEEMLDLLRDLPLPYVAHFRIGTVGGNKPTLTHPFLVGSTADTELEGRTPGAVLFHNGHWAEWNDKTLDAAIHSNSKLPIGDWSDSRAMAWMTHLYGPSVLELLTRQKAVIWSAQDYRVFTGSDGWEEINKVWCSNDNFWSKKRYVTSTRRICRSQTCANEVFFKDSDFCYLCQQKMKNTANVTDTDKEDHSSTRTTVGAISDKSAVPEAASTTLMALTGRTTPLVTFFSIEEANMLRSRGGMSKNKHKEYQKLWKKLEGDPSERQKERTIKKLTYISNIVGKDLLRGTVH